MDNTDRNELPPVPPASLVDRIRDWSRTVGDLAEDAMVLGVYMFAMLVMFIGSAFPVYEILSGAGVWKPVCAVASFVALVAAFKATAFIFRR